MTTGSIHEHVSRLEAQLAQWRAALEEVVARAKLAAQPADVERGKRLHELRAKLRAARSAIDAAKRAGDDTWETFEHGHAWTDLEGSFERLIH